MTHDTNGIYQLPDASFLVDRAIVVTARAVNAQTALIYTSGEEVSSQTCLTLEVAQLTEFVDKALSPEELRGRNLASVWNAPGSDPRRSN